MAPSKSKRRRAAPQTSESPWDRESAEALTQAYEESEAEWRETRAARRPPHDRGRAPPADQGNVGGAWLESRLVDIADRLQRSIAGIDPDKSASALGTRIEELEQRLAVAFEDVARRLEGHNLEKIEAQISGLNAHLEHTRGHIERIDAIDTRLEPRVGGRVGWRVNGGVTAAASEREREHPRNDRTTRPPAPAGGHPAQRRGHRSAHPVGSRSRR